MPAKIDVTGQRFGRLAVLCDGPRAPNGRRTVECQCDCGTKVVVDPRGLRNGHTRSCGCYHKDRLSQVVPEVHTTHGMSRTPEYNTWMKIRNRCSNPRDIKYKDYGARGIRVCSEWDNSFEAFYRYIGPKPHTSWSIDRIDVNGDYEPGNCRWADPKTQSRNKRKHRIVVLHGIEMPLSQACEAAGVNYRSALYRLNVGKHWQPLPAAPTEATNKEGENG